MKRFAIIAFAAVTAIAPARAVTAEQIVEKIVYSRDAAGREVATRVAADAVTPGEEVVYTLRYANDSGDAAEGVVLIMPVPREVAYVEGSVVGDGALVTFSADGGQTYVARGRLTVADAAGERPAKSSEITHVKWTLTAPLAAGAKGAVSYQGVLK